MLPILQFIFSSFWVWLGTAVLLGIVANGVQQLLIAVVTLVGGLRR